MRPESVDLRTPVPGRESNVPPLASCFGLMSFNWTARLDCFGCLADFVFMAVSFVLLAVFRVSAF